MLNRSCRSTILIGILVGVYPSPTNQGNERIKRVFTKSVVITIPLPTKSYVKGNGMVEARVIFGN